MTFHPTALIRALALLCAMNALPIGAAPASAQEGPYPIDRTVLPVAEPVRPTYSELDARNVKAPPRFEMKAPDRCAERRR